MFNNFNKGAVRPSRGSTPTWDGLSDRRSERDFDDDFGFRGFIIV
jgi:hypothetical protein